MASRTSDYITIKKSGRFDAAYYLVENPDVRATGIDPIRHYVKFGWKEGRNPSPYFNTRYYLKVNPDLEEMGINPLVHYLEHGLTQGREPLKGFTEETERKWQAEAQANLDLPRLTKVSADPIRGLKWLRKKFIVGIYFIRVRGFREFTQKLLEKLGNPQEKVKRVYRKAIQLFTDPYKAVYRQQLNTSAGSGTPEFVEYSERVKFNDPAEVKLIAFYLPQYHPFPENDAWWGKGFTEWTNVSKAVPQFLGHDQPRLPGELGYYDLRVPDVQRRQVELAKNYGIHGFCFHYYWFNGKRLLNLPLDQFINDPQIDFPFCVCWANENWTRTWDGRSDEVLIAQEHTFENDKRIIHDLVTLFENPRYIRIDGRPLLIVYRADILKDAQSTLQYWRETSIQHGTGDPFILMAQGFGVSDPRPEGFDGAVEFPPHYPRKDPEITRELTLLNHKYKGKVFRYSDIASSAMAGIRSEPYRRFNTVAPGWDNDSRRPGNGMTYFGSTPELYARWLNAACRFALNKKPPSERLVFINAWNEWGEAAYLEPDRRFGYAYLQATADVLDDLPNAEYRPRSDADSGGTTLNTADETRRWFASINRSNPSYAVFQSAVQNGEGDAEAARLASEIDGLLAGTAPSEGQSPTVSILLPVFNHFEETLNCLKSLGNSKEKTSFEVIIVDDCSNDETNAVLSRCRSLQYIRNQQNLGFLKNCNKAADLARGEFLVLLNNDTVVMPGWLDALVETFTQHPGTGLAGSKLLYPDGTLQEAGGVIWNDANGMNFGRGDDPDKPEYNYLRDADYCTGASICIPAAVWKEMGGLDELFAPAYYEDTDLAFRIRKAGYGVLYQPFSRVIHVEGVTSGTSLASGIKRYQVVNREKFLARWRDELKDHGDDLQPSIRYRNHTRRKHALVIDVATPKPDRDSGSIDTYQYLIALRKFGFEVTFISVVDPEVVDHYVTDLQKQGVECIYAPYLTWTGDYLLQNGRYFDLAVLTRAPYGGRFVDSVRKYAPHAKILFNTIDLHFLREQRESQLTGKGFKLHENMMKDEELGIMRKSDATIVVSEYEVGYLASIDKRLNVRYIPLATEIPGRSKGFEGRKNLAYVGGYLHVPNVDAVKYFIQEIWPLVSPRIPDAEFWIVGSNMPDELQALESEKIKAVGFIEDLNSLYSDLKISVAPLRYGAGVKGKILHSLSFGVPCAATTIATEGTGLVNEENVLVGDTPEAFADAVVRMYTDAPTWEKCSWNGLAFIQQNYSLQTFERNLERLLNDLGLLPKKDPTRREP